MKLSLMVTEGIHTGEVITVNGVCLLIGRAPQCHVRPNSPAVSQRHCVLLQRADRAFVRDLDNQTGTFLNGRQLRGEIELRDGDFLQVGPLVFLVQLQAEAAAEPALTAIDDPAALSEPGTYASQRRTLESTYPSGETQEMPALEADALTLLPEGTVVAASAATNGRGATAPRRTRATWSDTRCRTPT
jgi:pSer/pThr/pTyr-binding forkhead associated (FHA) protein